MSNIITGEVRNIPAPVRGKDVRDCYVIVALDKEEIFRTATVEKTLRSEVIQCE